MSRRGRKKTLQNKRVDSLSDYSSLGPIATSSPDQKISKPTSIKYINKMKDQFKEFKEKNSKAVRDVLLGIDLELLDIPFNWYIVNETIKDLKEKKSSGQEEKAAKETESSALEFKMPLSLPKRNKKGHLNVCATNSKSVHWDSDIDLDSEEANIFKTPALKKGFSKSTTKDSNYTGFKTPTVSHDFAVVTPGPSMIKNVRVLRMPEAGETAVSLSGSPLFVTPFGNSHKPQVTLTLPSDGRVMTIVPPRNSVEPSDQLFSHMDYETKEQLIKLGHFLIDNVKSE